jgi:hypothetical protein
MQRGSFKLLLKTSLVVIFIVTLVVYSYTKSKNLLSGPSITILSPQNGSATSSPAINLKGIARNINAIQLNDRPIFIDEEGNFNELVVLASGYNAFRFNAKDKFGREQVKTVEFVYTAPPKPLPTPLSTTTASTSARNIKHF